MTSFFKNIQLILSLLLFLVCSYPVSAHKSAPSSGNVIILCPLNGGRIGDPIFFVLKVQLAESAILEPSSLSHLELRPAGADGQNLQKEFFEFEFVPFDHIKMSAKKNFTINGVLRFYAPGRYRLAPVVLVYRLADSQDGNRDDNSGDSSGKLVTCRIESNSIEVRIAGLHPENKSSPALVIPEAEPRFSPTGLDGWHFRSRFYRWAISAALLLALFFGIISYFRRDKTPTPQLKGERERIKEIAQVLSSTLKQVKIDSHWHYLVELDHLLRNFLLAELNLLDGGARGGSGVAFTQLLLPALEMKTVLRLQKLWSEIDRVVALEVEEYQGFADLRRGLLAWLREYADKKGADYGF